LKRDLLSSDDPELKEEVVSISAKKRTEERRVQGEKRHVPRKRGSLGGREGKNR